jgi:adenylate cyclase
VVLFAFATGLMFRDIWLPTAQIDLAMLASGLLGTMTRYFVIDLRRRQVERAFGHYVPPELVNRYAQNLASLQLGGEARDVSIMFADLSGFTALSEKVTPAELMAVTNRYLGYISDEVTATGGSIDKYIGDAVMAIWGAPIGDPNHALNAVRTARAAVGRVQREHDAAKSRGEIGYTVKIGINSGTAVVGNVGASNRFNYTAVGETVNIAARLESLPKEYGCTIVVGENTAPPISSEFLLVELDWIRVKGKVKAISIYTPLVELDRASDAEQEFARDFARALATYREGRFDLARSMWLALDDPFGEHGPSRIMAERAGEYAAEPPPMPFDGIYVRMSK